MSEQTPTTTSHGRVIHHAEIPEEHPERHEHTDVSVRGIWITVGAVIVVTAIVHVIMYVVFFAYEGAQKAEDEAQRRSAIGDVVAGPPAEVPRLQGIESFNADTPALELTKMRQENARLVNGYGRTADGRAYIPIDRAMDLALTSDLFRARGGTVSAPAQGGATTKPAGGGHAGQ